MDRHPMAKVRPLERFCGAAVWPSLAPMVPILVAGPAVTHTDPAALGAGPIPVPGHPLAPLLVAVVGRLVVPSPQAVQLGGPVVVATCLPP